MPKPQTVLCYICGREFGSYSINVHERQCAKRWEKQRGKEKEVEKSEQRRNSKDKLLDPWVKRVGPSIKAHSKYSKSMNDIRVTNGVHGTKIEREMLHNARPATVTLKDRDEVNGHLSAEEPESIYTTSGEVSPEIPKISRPGTAVINKKYSSPLLPSKINPVSLMKAKNGEAEENSEKKKEKNDSISSNTLNKPSIISLRKHSAPEPISTRISNTSPVSSASSHSSTDLQDATVGIEEGMPRFRSTKNPNLLVCYICGNEFGSKSLKIHEPQCLKKWKLANPRLYSRKGSHGGMFKTDSVNSLNHKENFVQSNNGGLPNSMTHKVTPKSASCDNLLDACMSGNFKPTNSLQALKELSKSHSRLYTPSAKPKMEPCYICGKEIMKHSLGVHEKQCKKKWDTLKEKKEKKLSAAGELPPKRHSIHLPVSIKIDKTEDIENNNLDNCQQSQEEINVSGAERKTSTTKGAAKERKLSTITCYICGRAYGTASILIHEKQCQKKWEAATAKKDAQLRPKSGKKKTKPRPSSFVL